MNIKKIALVSSLMINGFGVVAPAKAVDLTPTFIEPPQRQPIFYCACSYGGAYGNGTIFSVDAGVPEPLNILGATAGLALFGTTSTALKRRKLSK